MKGSATLLALTLAVAGCGQPPIPSPAPQLPPAELAFLQQVTGGHLVIEARDGARVAQLAAAILVTGLSEGGDVDEAFLVGPEPDGIRNVRVGRPFTISKVAAGPASGPLQALLAPAPNLVTFVGHKTVLVVLEGDGALAGYQAGHQLWRQPTANAAGIVRAGDLAMVHRPDGWWQLDPASGRLAALPAGCFPVAGLGTEPVLLCSLPTPRLVAGASSAELPAAATGSIWMLRPVRLPEVFVFFSGGLLCRAGAGISCHPVPGASSLGRPALSPDGRLLYLPAGDSVLEQPVGGGAARQIAAGGPYSAVATSRDGSQLYGLGGGHLDIWNLGQVPSRLRSYAADATDIELVAGG